MNLPSSSTSRIIKNSYSWFFFNVSSIDTILSTIASLTGLVIGQFLTQSEQNAIGNWLECVGQVLLTMGTKPYINNYNNELLSRVKYLEKEIEQLKSNLYNTN